MFLSKTCIYGLRATLFTASYGGEEYVSIRRISEGLGISFHFLTKILQSLTQKGIMNSYRGPKGGIILARPADKITVAEIIMAIDGPDLFDQCILGLPGCGELKPCPMHEQWGQHRANLRKMFEETSIAELAGKITSEGMRIGGQIFNDWNKL